MHPVEAFVEDVQGRGLAAFYLFLVIQELIDLAAHWVRRRRLGRAGRRVRDVRSAGTPQRQHSRSCRVVARSRWASKSDRVRLRAPGSSTAARRVARGGASAPPVSRCRRRRCRPVTIPTKKGLESSAACSASEARVTRPGQARSNQPQDRLPEAPKVFEMIAEDPDKDDWVQAGVVMHDDIAKPRHLHQSGMQGLVEQSGFAEHVEDLREVDGTRSRLSAIR